ncbi:hypothetical protein BH09PSE1_BH09PSE1_15500 [soil metagenome]
MSEQMTPEQKLSALFAADEAPVSDVAFVAEVAGRIAFRRAVATVLAMVPWFVATTAILWVLAPVAAPLVGGLEAALSPVLGGVALAAAALVGAVVVDSGLRRRFVGSLQR